MAEKSILWTTGGAGDSAAAYTQDEVTRMFRYLLAPGANEGVLMGVDGALAVSGGSSPLEVATGWAVVYGFPYYNDSPLSVSVPTPAVGTTGHRIVLRASWAAKTVRITLLSSADGTAALPALTQTPATTYDIPLAGLTITTGGVITLTDARTYAHPPTNINANNFTPGVGAVTGEAALNRLLPLLARQGSSGTDWNGGGTTNYTPGLVKMLTGIVSNPVATSLSVTFPDGGFSSKPLVFCQSAGGTPVGCSAITNTGMTIKSNDSGALFADNVYWLAIGPG